MMFVTSFFPTGSPPRVRVKRRGPGQWGYVYGITPARAGKTLKDPPKITIFD